MKTTRAPQEIKIENLPDGISQEALNEHYNVLYKGYINKYNEIQEALETTNSGEANSSYSRFRELKKEETFVANAISLHESYFKGLNGNGQCLGKITDWIKRDFGSCENWESQWLACGMSARGWVVLAYDVNEGRLHNYTLDIHSDGVWNAVSLMVLDVYEHAYYLDFKASGKKKYIESFMGSINWSHVNKLIETMGLEKIREAA